MKTKIEKINLQSLEEAKRLLQSGGLVAFPTETVYGLGANAFSDEAVKNIYKVKGRPSDNPLICHVHKDYDITKLVEITNDYAKKIADAFLPGPLTMVYKSKGVTTKFMSCGLDTLAIRIPKSEEAQEFLRFVDLPIAAPSANISKHVSPVTAEHVFDDFNGKIPLILDGGRCEGGIESTVLDVTGDKPVILRKGLVTAEMIAKVCGSCSYASENISGKVASPGMKYRHYCPNCETAIFKRNDIKSAVCLYDNLVKQGIKTAFLCDDEMAGLLGAREILRLGADGKEMAENLYELLREGEDRYDYLITFELKIDSELMMSVNNRFSKAFFKEKN